SNKSVEGIVKGKVTLGADASIAAGPMGRQAAAATDLNLKAEIYSYSRSRGIFAGVSLEGSSLRIDQEATSKFYNVDDVSPEKVFSGISPPAPEAAERFKKVLRSHGE
ncbi:MAG: YSC84-related protein, partial [Spirochaetota bacterium]